MILESKVIDKLTNIHMATSCSAMFMLSRSKNACRIFRIVRNIKTPCILEIGLFQFLMTIIRTECHVN